MSALRDSGSIAPEWYHQPQKGFFQRASRTDKGVSALKMIVSLKMREYTLDTPYVFIREKLYKN